VAKELLGEAFGGIVGSDRWSGYHRLLFSAFVGLGMAGGVLAQPVPADRPPDFVPLGVDLSWERPGAWAAYYGKDRWTDVCQRLDALESNHVNLLWVTNMADEDLPRLIEECRKRKLWFFRT